jgi:hypothetical protein
VTVRIRLQFDQGAMHLDLAELPRIGEGLVLPKPHPAQLFRVTDVAHYAHEAGSMPSFAQRIDVRVAGTLEGGPRDLSEVKLP